MSFKFSSFQNGTRTAVDFFSGTFGSDLSPRGKAFAFMLEGIRDPLSPSMRTTDSSDDLLGEGENGSVVLFGAERQGSLVSPIWVMLHRRSCLMVAPSPEEGADDRLRRLFCGAGWILALSAMTSATSIWYVESNLIIWLSSCWHIESL
jgi:hypothetical protein